MWNDQPPTEDVSTSFAHSKGALFVDPKSSKGFHFTHSVPRFPKIEGDKVSPITNVDSAYGQSFVCVSIKHKATTVAKTIYKQLVDTNVFFYKDTTGFADSKSEVPRENLTERLNSALILAKEGKFSQATKMALGFNKPDTGARLLSGKSKVDLTQTPMLLEFPETPFTLISKHKKMKVPVFNDFLIPGLTSAFENLPDDFGLAVESWSRPRIESVCKHSSSHRIVTNIKRVQFGLVGQKVSQDHSKWAIGVNGGEGIVCVGGMNNMTSQEKRGGSFLCLKDEQVWTSFKNIIIDNDCDDLF
jgi:deoxyribonuclease-2